MTRPLLGFLALGGLVFALERALLAPAPVLAIPAARVAALERAHLERTGRAPDAAERRALLELEIEDELLLREARSAGLDRDDPVVRQRLLRNMRFLLDAGAAGDEELLRQARELGLDRDDPVVRRRLIQQMRLRLEQAADDAEPSEAELRAFLRAHPERFAGPARVRLSHRAAASPVPADLPPLSQRELEKLFGPEFARAAFAAPLGVWTGPLASSHGEHRVYLHERVAPEPPSLEGVRSQVRAALLAERRSQAGRQALAALRDGVRIDVRR